MGMVYLGKRPLWYVPLFGQVKLLHNHKFHGVFCFSGGMGTDAGKEGRQKVSWHDSVV